MTLVIRGGGADAVTMSGPRHTWPGVTTVSVNETQTITDDAPANECFYGGYRTRTWSHTYPRIDMTQGGVPVQRQLFSTRPDLVNWSDSGVPELSLEQRFVESTGWVLANALTYEGGEAFRIVGDLLSVFDNRIRYAAPAPGSIGADTEAVLTAIMDGNGAWSLAKTQLFSTRDPATGSFVRNTSNVVTPIVDLTPLGMDSQGWSMTLVSPRHILSAHHVGVSGPVYFVDMAGNTYSATVLASQKTMDDTRVSYLSTPIPSAILPASIFSDAALAAYPAFSVGTPYPLDPRSDEYKAPLRVFIRKRNGIPGVANSSDRIAWGPHNSYGGAVLGGNWFKPSPDYSVSGSWSDYAYGGDSSGQLFLSYQGKTVLQAHFWTAFGGECLAFHASKIEAAMNALALSAGDTNQYALNRVGP